MDPLHGAEVRDCSCPEIAQIWIGTVGSPHEYLCNCCGQTYVDTPPPVELYPWEKPGHQCVHTEGS